MNRIGVWILAARLRTLPAAIAPVVLGVVLAFEAGEAHWPSAGAALMGAILIQIGTNFANDYFDFVKGTDRADRIGPLRATQAGLVTPSQMRVAMIVCFALVFVPGAYILLRGGWAFMVIGLVSIACGVLYTGGPYPLGYIGLGDVFVLIFFGPVAVGGTYFLQTLRIGPEVIVAGLMPGLISVAILTVNNLRDIDTDRVSGKKTLAVRFGRGFARWEYAISLLGACVIVPGWLCYQAGGHWAAMACVLALLRAVPIVRTVFTTLEGPTLNSGLAATGQVLLLQTVLFCVGWLM